jgi:hypothetical protein
MDHVLDTLNGGRDRVRGCHGQSVIFGVGQGDGPTSAAKSVHGCPEQPVSEQALTLVLRRGSEPASGAIIVR